MFVLIRAFTLYNQNSDRMHFNIGDYHDRQWDYSDKCISDPRDVFEDVT